MGKGWIFDGLLCIFCAIAGMALGYLFGYMRGFSNGQERIDVRMTVTEVMQHDKIEESGESDD